MEALDKIITVPSWAYDFCYYYFAVAAVIAVYAMYALFQLFTLPSVVKKFVPVTAMALALILSAGFSVVLSLMQFWVCRSALKPSELKEKFAAKCSTTADCKAITGTPQPDTCQCGGRGLCGGCVMQNNMEPAMLPEYGEPFAAISEGFRVNNRGGR